MSRVAWGAAAAGLGACQFSAEQKAAVENALVGAPAVADSSQSIGKGAADHSPSDSGVAGGGPSVGQGGASSRSSAANSCHQTTTYRSVDLLFVTDTSGSLQEERAAIADGIDGFVMALPRGVDYRIAVMQGHSSRSSMSGRLWRHASHGPVMDSQRQSLAEIRADLRYLLTHTSSDQAGDGGEEMLYSLNRGLGHGELTSSRAQGFFREDAALAVIFVTDENDICAEFPAGVQRVPDPDGLEAPAFRRDCGGINPQSVLSALRRLQGGRPLSVNAIAYTDVNRVPRHGENEYAYGIVDIVRLANGVLVNLADGSFTPGLNEIGQWTVSRLEQNCQPEPMPSPSGAPSPEPSVTPEPSASPEPSPVPSVTASPEPSVTPQPTPSPTPTPTPAPSATPSPESTCTVDCGGGVLGV